MATPPGTAPSTDLPTSRAGTHALRLGIGGPVGSGKTALVLALCRAMRDRSTSRWCQLHLHARRRFLSANAGLPAVNAAALIPGLSDRRSARRLDEPAAVATDHAFRGAACHESVADTGGYFP